jgi:ABC-2 type transport system permease protein
VAASPGLSIVGRAGDLASAARAIRSGEAIGAVYVPANFERDLKADRRPQVVAFYNQQFLTAAGVVSSGLSDSLAAATKSAVVPAAPKPSRIGALVAETIVLVNPQRNYAQFLLRTLLPVVLHVIVAIAAGYAVGSEFHRRSMRAWLACAGGNPIVALVGKLAPLFAIFFVIMLTVPLILEGLLGVAFKGNVPMIVVAASLFLISYLALSALLPGARPRDRAGPDWHRGLAGVRLLRRRIPRAWHECIRLRVGRVRVAVDRPLAFAVSR